MTLSWEREPLTTGKKILLALATLGASALGLTIGLLAAFDMTYAESGNKTIDVVPAFLIAGSLAGAIAAGPLAWSFRSKRAVAIGAGVGATLGIAVIPFL